MQAQVDGDTSTELPSVLTAEECRTYMRLGRSTFYELLRTNRIKPAIRMGQQWRIPRDSFLAWLQSGGMQDIGHGYEG